ncbi:peptidyl-prolyl cis-trans isomerase [Magnetovirga frankeli]|uniref:peptidylprolyl isomerase n=1 Tax=Magnetovirga frankeli TaxID=947516 RepID=UPI001293599C|nr:peptidyl-prolyl cis-trans isomerase [gamma proteobacterium SS-5]
MHAIRPLILASLLLIGSGSLLAAPIKVLMQTSLGDISLQLDADKAPKTVENFLRYVDKGFYDGTIFHRVIYDFMIQGGGFDRDLNKKQTLAPVRNEAKNGLKNDRGSIAMARTADPHSATAQFFINHADNNNLDHPSFDGWGYTVFGKVIDGMDVVDKIAEQATEDRPGGLQNVPKKTVVIKSIKRL